MGTRLNGRKGAASPTGSGDPVRPGSAAASDKPGASRGRARSAADGDELADADPLRLENLAVGDEERSALSLYFREMGAVDLMTPDEERLAAMTIVKHREAYWEAIFGYPPFAEAVVGLVIQIVPPERLPGTALEPLVEAAREARNRDLRKTRDAFDLAAKHAAQAMAMADPDGDVSFVIQDELDAIHRGETEYRRLTVTMPRRDSKPYDAYVRKVSEAEQALWDQKNEFVRANLRLVVTMARRFNRGRLSLPDLIQEGNIGLMKAVDRFDPRRGFRFSTYGSWWIRHAISRALADKGREVRVPVHMLDLHHKLTRVRRTFELREGRPPDDEELADLAGVPMEKIARMRQCLLDQGPSLDTPLSEQDGRTGADLLVDDGSPSAGERLADQALGAKVREYLGRLPPIEADVLRKRFGLDRDDPMTLREIGEQYSLSRERIRQLQEQALSRIRRELRRNDMI